MKSVPFTSRGPVDDTNFSWVETRPRLYQSKGDMGFGGLRHSHTATHHTSHHRSHTTGSVTSSSIPGDRDSTVLPKIATGRSVRSAKLMWRDHGNIKIKTYIQNELESQKMPPLYVPKNPKPLYKRPVDEWKQFNILHFRDFAENGEIEPDDVTDCSEFYSQITFLRNAVRNIDGTTSYQNLCKKPRSWSEPSVVDDQPGLIAGNRLHWQSASLSQRHPRMLLPLKPGPTTKWYAWRNAVQSNVDKDKHKSKRKGGKDRHEHFVHAFTPRNAPHPTPATLKAPQTSEDSRKHDNHRLMQIPDAGTPSSTPHPATSPKQDVDRQGDEESNKVVEQHGLTFITESKEENVVQTESKRGLQETQNGDISPANERVNNDTNYRVEEGRLEYDQRESEDQKNNGDREAETEAKESSTHQDGADGINNKEVDNAQENCSTADDQIGSENNDQAPSDQDDHHPKKGEETNEGEKDDMKEDSFQDCGLDDGEDNTTILNSNEQPPAEDINQEENFDHQDKNQVESPNSETREAVYRPEDTKEVAAPAGNDTDQS